MIYGKRVGTVTGSHKGAGLVVDFGAGDEKTVAPGSLQMVPRACRAGTRVRHLKYGDGTCTALGVNRVTVLFDKHGEQKILLPFLQILNNEANLGFPTQEHDANAGSFPYDASQGLVG